MHYCTNLWTNMICQRNQLHIYQKQIQLPSFVLPNSFELYMNDRKKKK